MQFDIETPDGQVFTLDFNPGDSQGLRIVGADEDSMVPLSEAFSKADSDIAKETSERFSPRILRATTEGCQNFKIRHRLNGPRGSEWESWCYCEGVDHHIAPA